MLRGWFAGFISAALFLTGSAAVARASSLTVPDNAPSVSYAVVSGVDTVYIRPGAYPDSVTLQLPIVIIGLPAPDGTPPSVAGVRVNPYPVDGPIFPIYAISQLQLGRVVIENSDVSADIQLSHCTLLTGISDVSAYTTTHRATFTACNILGNVNVVVDGYCTLDSCQVDGHILVGYSDCRLTVVDTSIRGAGGNDSGILSEGSFLYSCHVVRSSISNFLRAIVLDADDSLIVEQSMIRSTENGIVSSSGTIMCVGDTINTGNIGVVCGALDNALFDGNVVYGCPGAGLRVGSDETITLRNNVIHHCGSGALVLGQDAKLIITNNTVFANVRAGLSLFSSYQYAGSTTATNNILFANGTYGIEWGDSASTCCGGSQPRTVGCNDFYGNSLGPVRNRLMDIADFELDPVLCDTVLGDGRLSSTSHVLGLAGCGQVGALGVGCGTTATLVSLFTADADPSGVIVRWQVSSLAGDSWVERSDSPSGVWAHVSGQTTGEGATHLTLDRDALPDNVYWYRLVAPSAGQVVVLAGPIRVETTPVARFAITHVPQNPCFGPMHIGFALARAASVGLDVFDVQGRHVASLAHGTLGAGEHTAEWRQATPGVYLLDYRFPGGHETRRFVTVR